MPPLTDEMRYKILKFLENDPNISQRQLADVLGISLGKVNYCLKALINKGLIKIKNFTHSKNKQAYVYQLTPKGIEDKAMVTYRFLMRKIDEYKEIESEIRDLQEEVARIKNQAAKEII